VIGGEIEMMSLGSELSQCELLSRTYRRVKDLSYSWAARTLPGPAQQQRVPTRRAQASAFG
jgi:hypothetical protein